MTRGRFKRSGVCAGAARPSDGRLRQGASESINVNEIVGGNGPRHLFRPASIDGRRAP